MTPSSDLFLVAGLPPLGRHCTRVLKTTFGVTVHVIAAPADEAAAARLRRDGLADRLVVGDPREREVLAEAGVAAARAILLVDADERVNVAAAFAARALNPRVRLVLRSAQRNLNTLLARSLGNLVAYEPTELSASAFALAGMAGETVGLVPVADGFLTVLQRTLPDGHGWCDGRRLHEMNGRHRRILAHAPAGVGGGLGRWDAARPLAPGDRVVWVQREGLERGPGEAAAAGALPAAAGTERDRPRLRERIVTAWRRASPAQRGIVALGSALGVLFLLAAALYAEAYPDIGLGNALNVALVLTLGGYQEIFGQMALPVPIGFWMLMFSLLVSLAGTAFVGILYAALTAQIMGARFTFLQRRPPPPAEGHVIVVGLNEVGCRVAALLTDLHQPVVGVHDVPVQAGVLPALPVLTGPPAETLLRAQVAGARAVLAMTADEVANLEIALAARAANPACRLVIRTDDPGFGRDLAALVPGAAAFGTHSLAAEAFTGAAFGEHIHDLFHLDGEPVLVTEYRIDPGDTLDGRLLAEIAHGYGVVPVFLQRAGDGAEDALPAEDERLHPGDRLTVLATTEGLQRVETGRLHPRTARLHLDRALNQQALFHGAMTIARIAGCEPGAAREQMNRLPGPLAFPLYTAQAHRLAAELGKRGVRAHVVGEEAPAPAG